MATQNYLGLGNYIYHIFSISVNSRNLKSIITELSAHDQNSHGSVHHRKSHVSAHDRNCHGSVHDQNNHVSVHDQIARADIRQEYSKITQTNSIMVKHETSKRSLDI